MWAEEGTPTTLDQMGQPVPTAPLVIGSIRLAVRVSYLVLMQSMTDFIGWSIILHPYSYCYCMSSSFVFHIEFHIIPMQVL